ncbi:MAG: hypothetical protein AAGI70_12050 [Pseudomonadota bacterium]
MGPGEPFTGYFEHRLDKKGRVSMPSQFREVLREHGSADQMVLIAPYGGKACFRAFSQDGHRMYLMDLREREYASSAEREAVWRHFTTGARPILIEPDGRITLGPRIRERLGLPNGGELSLAGFGRTFEIWSRDIFYRDVGPPDEPAMIDIDLGDLL